VIAGLVAAALGAGTASGGESRGASAASVQPASFDASAGSNARQAIRFGRRPARAGDEVEQAVGLEMRLATIERRGNQMGDRSHTAIRAVQSRVVTTTAVASGRSTAVRVRYLKATKQLAAGDVPPSISEDDPHGIQPIAGKAYFCSRKAGNDGNLVITDAAGNIPPLDEYEIVAQHMDMVGRPNPLAEFLAGKSIGIGETVALPKEVAGKLFQLGDQFGDVTRFELTLEKLQVRNGTEHAVFLARIEAASNDASQMRMQVEGPFVVEADTCRAVRVDLIGPIGMSESRGTYSTAYQVIGTGQLKMRIASTYRDVQR
jgi:hypothetical protein